MQDITLEYAVEEHLADIVRIYNESIPSRMVTADLEAVSIESKVSWFNKHHKHTRPIWVAKQGAIVIGWISFENFHERPAYRFTAELSIYISNEFQSKGIGKYLLQFALSQCKSLEIKTVIGLIFGHNIRSCRLFESFGFEVWGSFPKIAELDHVERDLLMYGKRIH